jgi:hypothetical protein
MKTSIEHGLILKDASPFNFQLLNGKPKQIDTLSFEVYNPNLPWVAYQQFCEGFLFPLMINHYLGLDAQQWLAIYPDGIPAFVIAKILPFRSRFSLGSWLHVFLQYSVARKSDHNTNKGLSFSKRKLHRLLEHLYSLIGSLRFHNSNSQNWSTYYDEVHIDEYRSDKLKMIRSWIGAMDFVSCVDLGTNLGVFAKEAARYGRVIATDMDSRCINQLYLDIRNIPEKNIHPLLFDMATPAGSGGFIRPERKSFIERAKAELVLALAIIHHLVLIRNIPMTEIASFCNELATKYLIIEFVPISDPKVQLMMADKKIFHQPYDYDAFEQAFQLYFHIEQSQIIAGTERKMYWMKKRISYSAG